MRKLAIATTLLAFVVIMLGAFVRLSHAGLGCPDWPGCYGHLDWPQEQHEIEQANAAYPDRPAEPHKAWKEMVHRYLAGTLGLMIFSLVVLNFRRPPPERQTPLVLTLAMVVIFQALLGMWTVTLLLKPLVVTAHLLGGMLTLSLLAWLVIRLGGERSRTLPASGSLARVALFLVFLQIALGGWTSANYAALACPDFPQCQGQWLPETDYGEAFVLWRGLGIDYEGGVLDTPARTAIHFTHRLGAVLVLLVVGWLAARLLRGEAVERRWGALLLTALLLQWALGMANVLMGLPLFVAVLHNGGAALLLFILVNINARRNPQRRFT